MLNPPARDGLPKVVLPDQCFTDDVGICKASMCVFEKVSEVERFIGPYLENWMVGCREVCYTAGERVCR